MPISYSYLEEKNKRKEPLSKRIRSFYRAPRKSLIENQFNQKFYVDVSRIRIELEIINTAIFNRVKILLGKEKDSTHNVLSDGRMIYDLSADQISFYDFVNSNSINELETLDTLAGRINNLFFKIKQLEK